MTYITILKLNVFFIHDALDEVVENTGRKMSWNVSTKPKRNKLLPPVCVLFGGSVDKGDLNYPILMSLGKEKIKPNSKSFLMEEQDAKMMVYAPPWLLHTRLDQNLEE